MVHHRTSVQQGDPRHAIRTSRQRVEALRDRARREHDDDLHAFCDLALEWLDEQVLVEAQRLVWAYRCRTRATAPAGVTHDAWIASCAAWLTGAA